MDKDKIILKDGTSIETESILSIGCIKTKVSDEGALHSLKEKLSKDNLVKVAVQTGAGLTVGNYSDMVLLEDWTIRWETDGILATFGLRNKTEEEKMKEDIAALKENNSILDSAVGDLGTVVATLAEGGN